MSFIDRYTKFQRVTCFVFTWKYIVLHKVINTNKDQSNGITILLFSMSTMKRKLTYPLVRPKKNTWPSKSTNLVYPIKAMQSLLWDLSSVCMHVCLFVLKDTTWSKKMKCIKKLKWQQFRISCIYTSEDIFSEWCLIPSNPQMKSATGNIDAPCVDCFIPSKERHAWLRGTVLSAVWRRRR